MASIVIGLALVPATRGRLDTLWQTKINASILLPLALLMQTVPSRTAFGVDLVGAQSLVVVVLWSVGAVLLIVACSRNWRMYGMRIIAVGVICNAVVILLNQGMPVGAGAIGTLGDVSGAMNQLVSSPLYHLETETTRALVLADVVPVPGPPALRAVVSLGDLLIFSGVVASIVQSGLAHRLGRPRSW